MRAVTAARLGGVPHGLEAEVRATPGLRAAAPIATTTVLTRRLAFGDDEGLQDRTALVLGPDASAVIDLDVAHGSLSDLRGATIAVDERVGAVGESRDLVLGDGAAVRARVVATTTARRDEFRALLRLGATPGQLRRMLRWEALLTAGAAATAGVLLVGAVAWLATALPARRVSFIGTRKSWPDYPG
ncbi:putative integral membrane [[Actinomadura] parvosata subsp. kistnae]|uniref:ABC3 transporter permease C-terminal domain-containing protein n=1 Tax=[Actinomadura] parvosata subsp. kistnae TaxID=1909395 RepID=A0A1U9ZZW5_9ACTN|nr:FtsX-like permease family protein [Nonomuraea sp. ATCC 55076]AQZ63494.1 hypothetical protein BKM31_20300 [Nonomuraea sp. ATCC 55076]SPL99232.1 putative integral membrane [Actinomadura parvosata subsp. kistnae]